MPSRYVAGVWARKYRGLSESDRNNVNQLTNARFRAATNVHRKLDPKRDRALCDEWLRLRDEVMQEGARSGFRGELFMGLPSPQQVINGVGNGLSMAATAVETIARAADTPWMDVALGELRRGVAVKAGKEAHPRIMMYSRTCPHLYGNQKQRDYMADRGDEGFKWCSTFVNWCMKEVGIPGTKNALATSWLKWGRRITKPEVGAVVVIKTKSWNHVAFVSQVTPTLKMLGGNQKPERGRGPQCVSYQRIYKSQVAGYRMPF